MQARVARVDLLGLETALLSDLPVFLLSLIRIHPTFSHINHHSQPIPTSQQKDHINIYPPK